MNRYKSSQKWRKVGAGEYKSLDGQWLARRGNKQWILHSHVESDSLPYDWLILSSFLTLADCQEHAERLERRDANV